MVFNCNKVPPNFLHVVRRIDDLTQPLCVQILANHSPVIIKLLKAFLTALTSFLTTLAYFCLSVRTIGCSSPLAFWSWKILLPFNCIYFYLLPGEKKVIWKEPSKCHKATYVVVLCKLCIMQCGFVGGYAVPYYAVCFKKNLHFNCLLAPLLSIKTPCMSLCEDESVPPSCDCTIAEICQLYQDDKKKALKKHQFQLFR